MGSQHFFGVVIAATCILCYYNSINCGFVFDDISAIKENRDLRPHSPLKNIFLNDFWGTPMQKEQSHKSYRPLCVLTFRWNYFFHGLEPAGYHLVNMLLHTLVSLMYYRMCAMLLPEIASFAAAMLFSVHPIHTEAVTGVVGRAETLSSVFFLGAFIFYTKATKRKKSTGWRHLAVSMIFVATAMLCKEQGITVTGVCAIYEIFVAQKVRLSDLQHFTRSILGSKSIGGSGFSSGGVTAATSSSSAQSSSVTSSTLFSSSSASTSSSSSYGSGGGCTARWPFEATRRLAVLCLTTIALLFVRLQIMGSQLPVFTRFDNPASVAATPARQLTYNYLISLNLWLLLFPCDLCCDWTMGTVPLVETFTDPRNLATLAAYTLLGTLVWIAIVSENRQQSGIVIMGLALMSLPFLPASNLFFPVGFVIAERVLYMPSMGFCLLVAYGFHLVHERFSKKLAWGCLIFLLASHGAKTYTRNVDWETEYSIFMSGLQVNQRNAKLFNNVGHALESEGQYREALNYFHMAVDVQEDDVGAHINVGRTFNHLKMFKEAEEAYLKAKSLLPKAKPGESYQARIAPNHLNVFLNLANLISKNHTRLEEADMLYRQAISMRADYTQAYINRGDILIKLNRTKEAQEVYERALLYDSTNPDIYYNLGVVFLEQGKASQALAYLDKALEFDPEHEQALLNSAILLQELGRVELRKIARERLLKLLAKDENNERVYFNLGMLAMDDRNIEEAENWFRRAVHLKHDFRSALFNLALLLADDHRPLEAAPFLNQLVKHHPDHIKGLILLGDIYINNIKDLDAAENCYKRILQLDPINIQGLHNLCVVYVERGKLVQAQACLEHAHYLAPHEDYIQRHLQIVQTRIGKINALPSGAKEKEIAYSEYDPEEFGGGSVLSNIDEVPVPISKTIPNPTPTNGENGGSNVGSLSSNKKIDSIENSENVKKDPRSKSDTKPELNKVVYPKVVNGGNGNTNHQRNNPASKQQTSKTKNEEPIFIESDAAIISSTIQDDYRPSNSGRAGTATATTNSNGGANGYHMHHHHHHHHHHHNTHRRNSKTNIGSDVDDPSSGMS